MEQSGKERYIKKESEGSLKKRTRRGEETHDLRLGVGVQRDLVVLIVESSGALGHGDRTGNVIKGKKGRESAKGFPFFTPRREKREMSIRSPPRNDIRLVEVLHRERELLPRSRLRSLERLRELTESEKGDVHRRSLDVLVSNESWREIPHSISKRNDIVVGDGGPENFRESSVRTQKDQVSQVSVSISCFSSQGDAWRKKRRSSPDDLPVLTTRTWRRY